MREQKDRYEIFLKVCETGSFSKAADALNYTQSGISQMMAGLEEELGVRLVPCTTIAGHCVLPAVPAKALRTSKGSAAGILAAFCRPETQQPWTALLGSELAVQLGIR